MSPALPVVSGRGAVRALEKQGFAQISQRRSHLNWLPTSPGGFLAILTNLVGSFLLGFYLARRERGVSARWSLQFWGIGMLGSFTTFSVFSLDVVHLVQDQRALTAVLYVFASLVAGLGLALVGERAGMVLR